jgi:hypothetical protein
MKSRLTILLTLIWTTALFGQTTSRDGLIGVYKSNGNSFERYSIMTLEANSRFTYRYGLGGCQGEVKGIWKVIDKKISFENDPSFLNDSIVRYPNLGSTTWTVKTIGIKPEQTIDSGCLKDNNLHLKEGLTSSEDFNVSIVRLIATPEKYHERKVQVAGYMNLEFEGDAIYLHKEDYENGLYKNSFWVTFSDKLDKKEINELNKRYVLIEGTFNKDRHGHLGLFGGEIYEITRIIKWGN